MDYHIIHYPVAFVLSGILFRTFLVNAYHNYVSFEIILIVGSFSVSITSKRMGDETFDGQALTEKLSKLNSSQQSIECILLMEY